MTWEKDIEELLLTGMKYAFEPRPTEDGSGMKFPEIIPAEFYGTPNKGIVNAPGYEQGEPGFLDAVLSTVRAVIKKEFYEGYYLGCCDTVADTQGAMTIDRDLNKQGASRNWEERQKEK